MLTRTTPKKFVAVFVIICIGTFLFGIATAWNVLHNSTIESLREGLSTFVQVTATIVGLQLAAVFFSLGKGPISTSDLNWEAWALLLGFIAVVGGLAILPGLSDKVNLESAKWFVYLVVTAGMASLLMIMLLLLRHLGSSNRNNSPK